MGPTCKCGPSVARAVAEPSPEPSPDGSFESTGGWEAPPGDSDGWPEPSPTPHKDRVDWDPPTRVPFSLTPAPSRICLVTSHFALPLDDGGDPTKLNQAFVDSLTTPVLDRKYRHYDENGEAMRSQLKQLLMQQQMMLHSLQETSTPPTVGDFDRAMRLLRRTTHYKVAKGLRERAATDARRRAARRSKSKRLQLKGGWPIDPIADARTAQRAKDALDGASILFQAARHYMMIEAAIVTNLLNAPTLSEVLVLYDGVTEENHCAHLRQRLLAQAAVALRRNGQPHDNIEGRIASLKCLDNPGGQPSYWEMFNTSSHSSLIESEVVVMGNGDGATDATVGQLASIEEGVAVMLSVTGFCDDTVLTQWETDQLLRQPSPQRVFEALIGPYDDVCHPKPKSRCLRTFEQRKQHARETFAEGHPGEWRYFRWPEQMLSWDGYAFRRPLPELSSKVLHPGIRMNLPGAENRAAMALYLALGRDALMYNRTLPNACGHVNWFHYHCTGAATVYDPTDSAAITTHEWRAMFGNASIPPASALAKSMGMAIGVDHTHDLELIVHDLIVPITSGCTEITDCLHSGKPDHRLLPDEVAFISGKEFDGVLWPPHPPPPPPSPPFEAEYEPSPSPEHDPLWKELLEWSPPPPPFTPKRALWAQPPFAPGTRRRRRGQSGRIRHHRRRRRRARRRARRRRPSRRTRRRTRRRPTGSGATSHCHRCRSRPPRRRRRRRRPRRRRRCRSRRRLRRRQRPTRALPNAARASPVNRCFRCRAAPTVPPR